MYKIILICALLFSPLPVFAEAQTYATHNIDLNKDNNAEYIVVKPYDPSENTARTPSYKPDFILEIYAAPDKERLNQFFVRGKFDRLEFISLNKDGRKQIAVWGTNEWNSRYLRICGLEGNLMATAGDTIEADFDATPPVVNSPSDTWTWNGTAFKRQAKANQLKPAEDNQLKQVQDNGCFVSRENE